MNWISLIGLVVLGGIGILLFWRRRQRRLTLTQHTVQCPEHGCRASVAVRTDPIAYPSGRYVDVAACSLLPSTSFVSPARKAYFADMSPPEPYLYDVGQAPCHSDEIACPKRCLLVLNAAESGAAEPIRCTSGISDGLELVRQTQSPAITRVLWYHSA
jgi:LPXTG-motif cell wall-anchored protein